MTRDEHLLCCLAEECAEVAQRVSKALRFGLSEVQKDQPLDNSERISGELKDLIAVAMLLEAREIIPDFMPSGDYFDAKVAKIERFMAISRAQGVLKDHPNG